MEVVIYFRSVYINEVFQTHRGGTGSANDRAGQLVTLAPATSSVFDDRERPYIMQVLHS